MFYRICLCPMPEIHERYYVERNTVWSCADKKNILIFIFSGSCSVTVDDVEHILVRGDSLLIPANHPYVRRPIDGGMCKLFYIHFITSKPIEAVSAEEMAEESETRLGAYEQAFVSYSSEFTGVNDKCYVAQSINLSDKIEIIEELFEKLRAARRCHWQCNELFSSIYLLKLFAYLEQQTLLSRTIPQYYPDKDFPEPLQKALLYIRQSYNQKVTLEDLSRVSSVSPQHLIRLFQKHLKTTPRQYINKCKAMYAIDMMRRGDLTIREIAYELGFDDPNYFSRFFKKEVQASPRQRREQIRNFKPTHRHETEDEEE